MTNNAELGHSLQLTGDKVEVLVMMSGRGWRDEDGSIKSVPVVFGVDSVVQYQAGEPLVM